MQLRLDRIQIDHDVTIGSLAVDGTWQCWTLEDVVRPKGIKVPGQTAIPFGRYRVVITPSPRFGHDLPLLVDVPFFAGVRIHAGNTATDTEGCILVGAERGSDGKSIGRSRVALDNLFIKLSGAIAKREQIWLEIW
jgi:hypothetical protein